MLQLLRWLAKPPPARLSGAVVAIIGALGAAIYVWAVKPTYDVEDWLAWPLLQIWGWVLLLNLAFVSLGHLLLVRVFRQRDLPTLETLVMSAALGVAAFAELMYVAGALHLFGKVFAPGIAVAMIAVGAPDLYRRWRRFRADGGGLPSLTGWSALLTALGGACVGLLYLGVMTPDAINYDASWSHLTIPQDYAREGRIVPFPSDYYRSLPHLASLVRTWDFCVPGLTPPLRWMQALHQEFVLFLWTLAGMSAACRWLCADDKLTASWVGFFLFPIIFVYDHNLGGAADHVAAFFTLPIMLATARLWERFEVRPAALLGCLLGASLLTKYQAVYLIAPVGLLFGPRWLVNVIRAVRTPGGAPRGRLAELSMIAGALVLGIGLVSAPHFLKNAIFYHNPVYPFMQRVFASRPSVPNAAFLFENNFTDINWVPKGTLLERLKHALLLSQTFSFVPHYSFTKNFPVFGSLFTLLLPILPFVRQRGRIALAVLMAFTGLFMWCYTFNVDRNLQVLMPVLAAPTVALIICAFRTSRLALLGLVPVVGVQLIWGGDALFYSSYDRVRSAMDLIRSGYEGQAKRRFDQYRAGWIALGKALPKDATALLHTSHVSLGADRRIHLDWAGFQGMISFDRLHTPREAYDYYRGLGITHLLYSPGERRAGSLQEDVIYSCLTNYYAGRSASSGAYKIVDLHQAPPPPEAPYRVATIGVNGYGSGVFAVEQLNTNEYLMTVPLRVYAKPQAPLPTSPEELEALHLDAIVVGSGSHIPKALRPVTDRSHAQVVAFSGQFSLYCKRPAP